MVQAFRGVDKLLLVSSNNREAIENRTLHHENVIKAAKEAKVNHSVYTPPLLENPDMRIQS